jgi:hypothetical protein
MKLDLSVAPEIALLARGPAAATAPGPGGGHGPRSTLGRLAGGLDVLLAEPQRWWDLVRFDPQRSMLAEMPAPGTGGRAWLLVAPPGYRGEGLGWDVACLVAGELAEQAVTPDGLVTRPLRAGRILVRGEASTGRVMVNTGSGYAILLGARPA